LVHTLRDQQSSEASTFLFHCRGDDVSLLSTRTTTTSLRFLFSASFLPRQILIAASIEEALQSLGGIDLL
jgi:hypothetical protein